MMLFAGMFLVLSYHLKTAIPDIQELKIIKTSNTTVNGLPILFGIFKIHVAMMG